MTVCTFVKPFHFQKTNGTMYAYGVGQYDMGNNAYNWYVLAHTANGRPELDSVKVTNPGPPVVVIPLH
jgi:hypothetical protein